MTTEKPIFSPRTRANDQIRPTEKQRAAFLESTAKEGGRELHGNDLIKYHQLLIEADTVLHQASQGSEQQDLRARMFHGVLDHTRFLNHELLSAVEEYKYCRHQLGSIDLNGPTEFILNAEKEMGRLNKKKIQDVMRMARLQEMVAERKKIVAELKKKWNAVAAELRSIALYIRDNLVRIEEVTGSSLMVLSDIETGRSKGRQLIEDIKTLFKDRVRDAHQRGQVTKKDLEDVRKDVDQLSREIAAYVKEDVRSLTMVYRQVHDHVRKTAIELAVLLTDIESRKDGSIDEKKALLTKGEQILVKLIGDHRFEQKALKTHTATGHDDIIRSKRAELIDHLFASVRKPAGVRANRRGAFDRRKRNDPNYKGPERRSGKDRRDVRHP